MASTITVGGECLRLSDYWDVVRGARVLVSRDVLDAVEKARRVYLEAARRGRVYGYDTGVGALQTAGRSYGEETLILEHAAGVGEYLDPRIARLVVLVRVVQLSRGGSPVRPVVVERLVELLNRDVIPLIPVYGSVGASGDLAPLAHLALVLLGRGRVYYRGRIVDADYALRDAGVEPLSLERGEALSLINGTAFSTAILLYVAARLAVLVEAWLEAVGYAIGSVTFNPEHYSIEAFYLKRHSIPESLANRFSSIVSSRRHVYRGVRLQDPYSLRCSVQALIAFYNAWLHAVRVGLCEACSPSDNPAVVGGRVLHQCSFHGVSVGMASDYLAIAMAMLGNIAERRIAQFLEWVRDKPFLGDKSSPHGLMIAHYTAASLAARLRSLASPHTIHNIPTSGLQEDFVSMSASASLRLLEALKTLEYIAAIEVLTIARLSSLIGVGVPNWMSGVLEETSRMGSVEVSRLINVAYKALAERVESSSLPEWAANETCREG